MTSKQLDLPPCICNPVGGVISLFKSPVARTDKANLEQEELESFQGSSALLAGVNSQRATFRLHSGMEECFIPHWHLVERWAITVIVLMKY